MKTLHAVLVALAAAATLTSAAAAGPEAARQRVAITSEGVANASSAGTFVLAPLQAGRVERDSGTESSVWNQRFVMRAGLRIEIVTWVTTLRGKRGTLVIRTRVENVEAGSGYHAALGTWNVVRGTGRYARVTGGGRVGTVWLEGGPWSERREGFLTVR